MISELNPQSDPQRTAITRDPEIAEIFYPSAPAGEQGDGGKQAFSDQSGVQQDGNGRETSGEFGTGSPGIVPNLRSPGVPVAGQNRLGPRPMSMAAFALPAAIPQIDLAAAIRTVTLNPALATGLTDRGQIARGKRADLVRIALAEDHPVVRAVWRQGRRV
eukprot:gene25718-46822_t